MTPLASHIYQRLRRRVRGNRPSVTYAELADSLDYRFAVHPRSPRFHAALGEITEACRRAALPSLPAMVWRADTRRPSAGYYRVAHPRAHTDEAQHAAWEREHAAVLRAAKQYPVSLGGQRRRA